MSLNNLPLPAAMAQDILNALDIIRIDTEKLFGLDPLHALGEETIRGFKNVRNGVQDIQRIVKELLLREFQERAQSAGGTYYNPSTTPTNSEQRTGALVMRVNSMAAQIEDNGDLVQNQLETDQPAALNPSVPPKFPEALGLRRQASYGEELGSRSSTKSSRARFRCRHPKCADDEDKAFEFESKLRDHELVHYPEEIKCLLCKGNAVFSRVRSYKKHHTRVHRDTNFKAKVHGGLQWGGTLAQLNPKNLRSLIQQSLPQGLTELYGTIYSAGSDGASDGVLDEATHLGLLNPPMPSPYADICYSYSGSSGNGSEAPPMETTCIDPRFLTRDGPHPRL